MSRWRKKFIERYPTIRALRKETKKIIDKGKELAFKEYYDAKSYKRLKETIRNT